MVDILQRIAMALKQQVPQGYDAQSAPSALSPLYEALAPAPNTEYGTILPIARDTVTGEKRAAMPNIFREGLGGMLDLAAGVETGQVTPRAAETLALGGLGAGMGAAPKGVFATGGAPIRAYHGSPHSFDKFDASKIGSGEGAQAYGHGLYFAENEGVARAYRETLGRGNDIQIAGKPLDRSKTDYYQEQAANWLKAAKNAASPIDDAIARATAWRDRMGSGQAAASADQTIAVLRDWQGQGAHVADAGKMYEVGIHADPARFLDWDKPLSAQGAPVQQTLSQFSDFGARPMTYGAMRDNYYKPMQEILAGTDVGRFVRPDDFFNPGAVDIAAVRQHLASDPDRIAKMDALIAKYQADTAPTGKDAYHWLARADEGEGLTSAKGSENLSYNLSEAGIPGIRYLDQGSRSAGQGSSNYVVFPGQEDIIEILRKYMMGVPAPVAAPPSPEQRGSIFEKVY